MKKQQAQHINKERGRKVLYLGRVMRDVRMRQSIDFTQSSWESDLNLLFAIVIGNERIRMNAQNKTNEDLTRVIQDVNDSISIGSSITTTTGEASWWGGEREIEEETFSKRRR